MNDQNKTEIRTICMDGDSIDVTFRYDEQWEVWIGEHPFFKEEPRYTPSGRPWRNAVYNECPHHGGEKYNDCGTCPHFKKQNTKDLIGVCFNDALRIDPAKVNEISIGGGNDK